MHGLACGHCSTWIGLPYHNGREWYHLIYDEGSDHTNQSVRNHLLFTGWSARDARRGRPLLCGYSFRILVVRTCEEGIRRRLERCHSIGILSMRCGWWCFTVVYVLGGSKFVAQTRGNQCMMQHDDGVVLPVPTAWPMVLALRHHADDCGHGYALGDEPARGVLALRSIVGWFLKSCRMSITLPFRLCG
jgi:hypothetical protein